MARAFTKRSGHSESCHHVVLYLSLAHGAQVLCCHDGLCAALAGTLHIPQACDSRSLAAVYCQLDKTVSRQSTKDDTAWAAKAYHRTTAKPATRIKQGTCYSLGRRVKPLGNSDIQPIQHEDEARTTINPSQQSKVCEDRVWRVQNLRHGLERERDAWGRRLPCDRKE